MAVMQSTDGVVRYEADRLQATAGDRLRRRRTIDRSPRSEQLALRAVRAARRGDPDALRFLYLTYADNVYGYVCSLVHDEHEAEDVTQQIFVRLPAKLERYECRLVPFSGWILRVAHNAAIDHMRARRVLPCEEVRGCGEPDHDLSAERGRDLFEALATLPEDQRKVVVMRFILGMSPGEIAGNLGRTEDAVHGLQHRGRRAMQSELTRLQAAPAAVA